VRALLPQPVEAVDLVETYSVGAPGNGPWFVRVSMVSSLDGAVALAGRSGGLGGEGDRQVLRALRSLCDVVLVGARTARAEHYRRARLPAELQQARLARGQGPLPPIAVVTRGTDLDWSSDLFGAGEPRTLLVAPEGVEPPGPDRSAVEVVPAGKGAVDLRAALSALHERGLHHVLCEGGPTLNAALSAAGLVDELCLTMSPMLVGPREGALLGGWSAGPARWADGPGGPDDRPRRLRLLSLLEEEGFLFLRLAASEPGDA
jgi:riboflavin biosynthesis pyrimidine reductase